MILITLKIWHWNPPHQALNTLISISCLDLHGPTSFMAMCIYAQKRRNEREGWQRVVSMFVSYDKVKFRRKVIPVVSSFTFLCELKFHLSILLYLLKLQLFLLCPQLTQFMWNLIYVGSTKINPIYMGPTKFNPIYVWPTKKSIQYAWDLKKSF